MAVNVGEIVKAHEADAELDRETLLLRAGFLLGMAINDSRNLGDEERLMLAKASKALMTLANRGAGR